MTVQERVKAGRALWEEVPNRGRGKIYRTVENVEGILLMKLRRAGPSEELSDPNWPGAAFATERTDGAYIETFLGYEHSSDPKRLPSLKSAVAMSPPNSIRATLPTSQVTVGWMSLTSRMVSAGVTRVLGKWLVKRRDRLQRAT
ncbi:MAG: hypothetical protein IPG34_12805 [Rhodocyclaceae bacterium]|nr:hypothetical protein [Rhodocyclaceae bacterium]